MSSIIDVKRPLGNRPAISSCGNAYYGTAGKLNPQCRPRSADLVRGLQGRRGAGWPGRLKQESAAAAGAADPDPQCRLKSASSVLAQAEKNGEVEAGSRKARRPLEQEPALAARIMIEDCLALLLDVQDIDRLFAASPSALFAHPLISNTRSPPPPVRCCQSFEIPVPLSSTRAVALCRPYHLVTVGHGTSLIALSHLNTSALLHQRRGKLMLSLCSPCELRRRLTRGGGGAAAAAGAADGRPGRIPAAGAARSRIAGK